MLITPSHWRYSLNSIDNTLLTKLSGGILVHASFTRSSINPYDCWNVASSSRCHSSFMICIVKLHSYTSPNCKVDRPHHTQPIGVKVCLTPTSRNCRGAVEASYRSTAFSRPVIVESFLISLPNLPLQESTQLKFSLCSPLVQSQLPSPSLASDIWVTWPTRMRFSSRCMLSFESSKWLILSSHMTLLSRLD